MPKKKKKCSDLQLNIKLDSTLEEMQPYVILQWPILNSKDKVRALGVCQCVFLHILNMLHVDEFMLCVKQSEAPSHLLNVTNRKQTPGVEWQLNTSSGPHLAPASPASCRAQVGRHTCIQRGNKVVSLVKGWPIIKNLGWKLFDSVVHVKKRGCTTPYSLIYIFWIYLLYLLRWAPSPSLCTFLELLRYYHSIMTKDFSCLKPF